MRERHPRPGILGAVDVGRQVATVDRPHTCTPATVGHKSRVNPGVAAMARAARDRCPSGLPPPLRVTTEPPTAPTVEVCRNPTAKAPVSRLCRRRPTAGRWPRTRRADTGAGWPRPEPAAVMVMCAASEGQARRPGACPATGRHIELRVAGHLSERARRVRRRSGRVRRGRDSDPGGSARPVPCPRAVGSVQLAGPPGDLAASDPAMRLSRSGGSDNASRARGGNHGSDR